MFWNKKPPAAAARPAPAADAESGTTAAPAAPNQALPADAQQAFNAGFQQHQAGRLAEAAASYRKVLARAPGHFGARHLLGVVALQEGRLDEARDEITHALRSNPRDGAAYGNLGTVHLRAGRLREARTSYETALQINPKDVNAASSLATVLRAQGDPAAAAARLREALGAGGGFELRNELGAALFEAGDAEGAIREFQAVLRKHPSHAAAQNNLGLALERSGDLQGALQAFNRAIALDANFAAATANRASLFARLGRLEEARADFERIAKREPTSASAHANLGAVLRELGEWAAARAALDQALALDPRLYEARFNLIQLLASMAQNARAHELLERLLADEPRRAEAHSLRGQLLLAQQRPAEAEAALARAIELDPQLAQAHHLRGLARMARGDDAGARESHERAVQIDPSHAQARWAAAMARLPVLLDDPAKAAPSRESFAAGVRELDAWFQGPRAVSARGAVGSTAPFYLAYQRGNHRDVLAPYGKLCARLAGAGAKVAAPAVAATGPIRIGIVSAHVRDHSVWTAIMRGWLAHLDRSRFDISLFSVGAQQDAYTEATKATVARFDGEPASAEEWAARITRAAPQVLIYPEVGMDPVTARLASRPLAPLQIASWGHPITTGLPTIDAFISAAALEPADAQAHYTEQLVALPGLGVCYEPLAVAPERIDLQRLGLPPGAPLLLCPGLPQKYAPEDDELWVGIAQRLPQARLVFFKGTIPLLHERLSNRLRERFAARGIHMEDHVAWLAQLTRPQFFALMREATLFLDSVGFSGFNTAMQGIECGLPLVALEADSMRGRFGSGILREVGLDECVATTREGYADIAVALAQDAGQREAVRAHLRKHAARLFGTAAPVHALAAFIEDRVRR